MAGRPKRDEFRERRRAIADAIRSVEMDVRFKRFGATGSEMLNAETLMQAIRNRLRACGLRIE